MDHGILVSLFALGLFLGMLMLLEVGRRIGVRRGRGDYSGTNQIVGRDYRDFDEFDWNDEEEGLRQE